MARLIHFILPIFAAFTLSAQTTRDAATLSPPPTLPAIERAAQVSRGQLDAVGPALYSIGDPSPEEQLYLEFINRARANPVVEATRLAQDGDSDILSALSFFNVDLVLFATQMALVPPAQPLAPNAKLLTAARLHTLDMFTNKFQQHAGSDGSNFTDRVEAQGYDWRIVAENIFAFADSVPHGFAGFEIDWGTGPGGMQDPPGHRENIHNPALREIGIGVLDGTNGVPGQGGVGPQLVTQDFASQVSSTPLVTGVVYYDLNGNNFYDLGEGLGGIKVEVSGAKFYAVTAKSGGYAVPVPTNGTFTVTFSGAGLAPTNFTAQIGPNNVKIDLTPVYHPPVLEGPDQVFLSDTNFLNFNAVVGASSYQWKEVPVVPYTTIEGAEAGTNGVLITITGNYPVIDSDKPASGGFAFHLAHPATADDQIIQLNHRFWPGTNTALRFSSFLGFATTNQQARAEVSLDEGQNWQVVWSKFGTGNSERGYSEQSVELGSYAGQPLWVRFVYGVPGTGKYYNQATPGVGWYIDNIRFANGEELLAETVHDGLDTNSVPFITNVQQDYLLSVRPRVSGRLFDYGPVKRLHAVFGPLSMRLTQVRRKSGQTQLDFAVIHPRPTTVYELQSSPDLLTWSTDSSAILTPIAGGFSFAASNNVAQLFYRVAAKP